MKKIFLTSLILSAFYLCNGFSQSLMPSTGSYWNVDYFDPNNSSCSQINGYCYSSTFFVGADTTIMSNTYHKVYKGPDLYIAYREDLVSEKVFVFDFQSGNESLLYDFSVSVGDTLTNMYNIQPWLGAVYVSSIDTIIVNSIPRQRFNLAGQFISNVQLIEGMGSTTGPFGDLQFFESGTILSCFNANGQTLYPSGSQICSPLSIPPAINTGNKISVYPNPFVSEINIEGKFTQIEVMDITGRQVYFTTNVSSTLDLSFIGAGIYSLSFMNDNGIVDNIKIVKSK